jgi:hypothetical protein
MVSPFTPQARGNGADTDRATLELVVMVVRSLVRYRPAGRGRPSRGVEGELGNVWVMSRRLC